jgi:hypothetical protein
MTTASDNMLKALQVEIRKMLNDVTDSMAGGQCEDFADYKYRSGVIYGLALAERELLDLDSRRIND